jgi:2'-5' RNA ligase
MPMSDRVRGKHGRGPRSPGGPADLRLFTAAYPPEAWAVAASARLPELGLPAHRQVPVEQVHLTLLFIGRAAPGDLETIRTSIERSASGLPACTLSPRRFITLPERGPSRLVAVETDAPATLIELVRRLGARLSTSPRRDPADRYRPHLTLCRFRQEAADFRVDADATDLGSFAFGSIRLVRSVLQPGGAEHRELARFDLE